MSEERKFQNGWFPYEPSKPARLLSPIVLAYVGDAIYEVSVRQYLVSLPNLRPNHLHRSATGLVSAKAQSAILGFLESSLTEEEKDVARQGEMLNREVFLRMQMCLNTVMLLLLSV